MGIYGGSLFINCTLNNTSFEGTECEGTEFRNCYGLGIRQFNSMSFVNKDNSKKDFLLILPYEKNTANDRLIYKTKRFYDEEDYKKWKESIQIIKLR